MNLRRGLFRLWILISMLWVIGGVGFVWTQIHNVTRFDVQSIVPIAGLLLGLGIMWTREGFR
jgi:Na+/melibiose symporter-like transporter